MVGSSNWATSLDAFDLAIHGFLPQDATRWLDGFLWWHGGQSWQPTFSTPIPGDMPRQWWWTGSFSHGQYPVCTTPPSMGSYCFFPICLIRTYPGDHWTDIHINDTDLVEIAHTPQEMMAIVGPHMQDKASCWNGGTRATGGAQKIEKCSWTPVKFVWDATSKWYYCTDIPGKIELPDEDGTIQTINKLAPSNALTVVGVEQSLDGNMAAQVAVLKEKAMALGNCIREGYLHWHLVRQSFQTMIWPSLQYPLPATCLDEAQSDFITKQLYKMMLPVGGTNRHFPTAFRHAPLDFFGLELPQTIDHQGIAQIHKLLTHGSITPLLAAWLIFHWSKCNWRSESDAPSSKRISPNMVSSLQIAG